MNTAHLSMEDLASDDDILSDILIDHLEWETPIATHKMSPTYRSARVDSNEVSAIVRKWCVEKQDVKGAVEQLCQLRVVQRYLAPRTPKQQSVFRAHMQRYLDCYLPNSGIEFALTMRYKQSPSAPLRSRRHKAIARLRALKADSSSLTENGNGNETLSNGTSHIHHRMQLPPLVGSDPESPGMLLSKADLCVLATHEFSPGEILHACRGGIADLSKDEDEQLRGDAAQQRSIKHSASSSGRSSTRSGAARASGSYRTPGLLGAGRDFSVIRSARKGCSQLFLGPARFVNHDCEPNVEFYRMGNQMAFRCIRPIRVNEEIVTYYGDNYFEMGNAECLCATCEARQQGAYTSALSAPVALPADGCPSPEEEDDTLPHESIAERASRRHTAAAAQATFPPNALSHYVDLQEIKYAAENSDTKDGHITRKMLDEPEALMENAGGGNTGPERECVTCRAHFWSKESWWTQEECSRCERHYKIFKADWPGRIPTEGLIARHKGKKPLQRLEQVRASRAEPKSDVPTREGVASKSEAPSRAKASLAHQSHLSRSDQSGSDGSATSRDGTPVVLTPLRASENPDYEPDHNPPPPKRRKVGSNRAQAREVSPRPAASASRAQAPPSRTPTPHTTYTSSTASSTSSTTSATTAHFHRRNSTPDTLARGRAPKADESMALEFTSRERSSKLGRTSNGRPNASPRPPDLGQEQASTSAVPLPTLERGNESDSSDPPWEGSDSGLSDDDDDSSQPREPASRAKAKKGRTSGASVASQARRQLSASSRGRRTRTAGAPDFDASLSTESNSDSSEAHLGPKMLGKQATTDALAAHWGATEDTGRFRRRTTQPPQPPQALFTYATGPTYRLDTSGESPGPSSRSRPRRSHPPAHRRTTSAASTSHAAGQHRRTVSAAVSDREMSAARRRSNGEVQVKQEDDSEPQDQPLLGPSRPRKKLRISDSQDIDSCSATSPPAIKAEAPGPAAVSHSSHPTEAIGQDSVVFYASGADESNGSLLPPRSASPEAGSGLDSDSSSSSEGVKGKGRARGRGSKSTAVDAVHPEIATKGSGRTSFNNLSLAWTAGMGQKRNRKAARSEPVLLASQQPASRPRRSQPRSSRSHSRSMSKDSQIRSPASLTVDMPGSPVTGSSSLLPLGSGEQARPKANSRAKGTASPAPLPSPAPLLSSAEPITRVKQEDLSDSLPSFGLSTSSRLASPPLAGPVAGGTASAPPAPSLGGGTSTTPGGTAGPTKIRRNLRWGGKKASFTRPLPTRAPLLPTHPPGMPHPDLSCPPDLQAKLSTLVERQERKLASPSLSASSNAFEDREDLLLPDPSRREPIVPAHPPPANDTSSAQA